jgi:hypothetical protein
MSQTQQHPFFSPRYIVLIAMIALAVASRLVAYFVPAALPPNFTPVESIALFGGAYFADRRLAFLVPLAVMALADAIIGFHALIPVVYGCIAFTVLLGLNLRNKDGALRVLGYSVSSAVLFFVVTNFFVWLTSSMYPLTMAGLGECFVAALPFFKWTLLGTLTWSAILFGGYALLRRQFPQLHNVPV